MSMLDVFNSDVFGTVSLTTALNKLPFAPSFLGNMGLFSRRSITDRNAVIEERHGVLALVPTSARGTAVNTENRPDRIARSFLCPHVQLNEGVLAEDVQSVRAFGSENQMETVAQLVNDRLMSMRQNIEVTREWHRAGAIQGVVKDADTSTDIYDLFTIFGITQKTVDFVLGTATTDTKAKVTEVIRHIENALGGTAFTGIVCVCGDAFWDAFVSHDSVKEAFARWQGLVDGASTGGLFERTSQRGGAGGFAGPGGQAGFNYGGVTWFNYRGNIGGTPFIPTTDARFFPMGAPGVFEEIYAPADYVETVNTMGQEMYAKQERMHMDKGIELEVQSNPLILCSRPAVLVRGFSSN